MNPGGDAAEQVVRLSLEGVEVAAKISGAGAKNIALLLYAALKEEQKAKGKAIGRPAVTADDLPYIFYKHYPKYKAGIINKKELSRLCSLSYPTIYKYLHIAETAH